MPICIHEIQGHQLGPWPQVKVHLGYCHHPELPWLYKLVEDAEAED